MATIRRLVAEDYDALLDVWRRSGLESLRPEGRDSRSAFEAQLEGGSVVLGLEEDGALLGAVVATHDGRKGWINRLAVVPERRRHGHATRLNRAAERVLEEQGLRIVAVLVEGWNEASLAFYRKAGYVVGDGIVYMTKRQSSSV